MMEDLSLHVLDLVENAAAAGARRVSLSVTESAARDQLVIRVTDDGRGLSPEEKARAFDPFFTTGRKRTGLGLPLLAHTAEACGGRVTLDSVPGHGARVIAVFRLGHVDRPPLTRMASTMMTLIFGHPDLTMAYRHSRNGRNFRYLRTGGPAGAALSPAAVRRAGKRLREGLRRIGAD
jgi:hypothetical protein